MGVRWTNKSEPIDEMAITMETGGRIFVDPAGNLVVKVVNEYDESAYRYAESYTVVTCKIKHLQKCFRAVDFPRLCMDVKML